jgi:hypothetical protein
MAVDSPQDPGLPEIPLQRDGELAPRPAAFERLGFMGSDGAA